MIADRLQRGHLVRFLFACLFYYCFVDIVFVFFFLH